MDSKPTIFSVQMLRGLAAILVVIAHAQVHLHVRGLVPALNPLLDMGRAGVDIFFIISGFIMVFISGNKFAKSNAARDFLIKRFIRVVPTYWLYTCVLAVLMLLLPHVVSQGKEVGLSHLIASMLFLPWENNIGQIKPLLAVGWTLNFEMYFYLVFSLLLFFSKKHFLLLLSLMLLSGLLIGSFFKSLPTLMYVMSSPLLLEFLIGSVIATIYMSRFKMSSALSVLLILLGLTGLLLSSEFDVPRYIKWGMPGALLITGLLFLEKNKLLPISSLLVKVGDSSYSLYLTHIFTINALGKLWVMFINDYFALYIVTAVLISPIIGHLAYLVLEKPLIGFFTKKYINFKSIKTTN